MTLGFENWTAASLWLAVIGSGVYHGINPGMGWPLAVSAGLMERSHRDLVAALGPLALGHFLAMAGILLPFAAMIALVQWQRDIQLGAGLLVIVAGIYLLVNRRHPRFLARIRPTRLILWSFAVAMAHGAGLMLVPIYLGLCTSEGVDVGHEAAAALMSGSFSTAIAVSVVHTGAMIIAGGSMALVAYRWLGPRLISQSWFNLDVVWALSLILVGGLGVLSGVELR